MMFWVLLGGVGIGVGMTSLVWALWWIRQMHSPSQRLYWVLGPPDPATVSDDRYVDDGS
jgi:hypothetical protein